jgi:hypothetical protein
MGRTGLVLWFADARCAEPHSAMAVIGLFGFVENSGALFEEAGLKEFKDRRAAENSSVGIGVTLFGG